VAGKAAGNMRKNDEAYAGILISLIFTLLFLAGAVAYFTGQIYGISIAVPNSKLNGAPILFNNEQNFSSCNFQSDTMGKSINSKWQNTCEVGEVLTQLSTSGGFSYYVIKNVQPDITGLYQNTYEINNTAVNMLGNHGDWCILLKFTGGTDQNEVCANSQGFYIPDYLIDSNTQWGYKYMYEYENANQIEYPVIKTVYKDKAGGLNLKFYLNDNQLFETSNLHEEGFNIFGQMRYYGGFGSYTLGATFQKFITGGSIVSGNTPDSVLDNIAGFIITIWKIATWTMPIEINFPNELSFLFDIIIIGIGICIVMIWRGN
jgi:hypothetical protein